MGADNSTVPVSINGTTVNIMPGRHTFGELRNILGLASTVNNLAVTAASQPSNVKHNYSYFIVGGEVITSS